MMYARKSISGFLLLIVLLLSGLAAAGVVEDAEEELKKLKKNGNPVKVETSGGFPRSAFPVNDFGGPASSDFSSDSVGKRNTVHTGGSRSGSQVGVVNIEGERESSPKQAARRPSSRAGKDRLYSLFGVLVLLALVAAGAVFSRDGVREE